MTFPHCTLALLTAVLTALPAAAQPPADAKADLLPIAKLPPAKLRPNQCLLTYRVSTRSPECQAHFDQGLGYFYSYVWMEAARSFETAARYDPDCAMAWWGLSRALEEWRGTNHMDALRKAQATLPKASDRERLLITARLQMKSLEGKFANDAERKAAATRTIDELIALYEDDQEAWFARAKLAGDGRPANSSPGRFNEVPFYKALLHVNPQHPGAHHELIHIYELSQRPGLGWVHAEGYIESSPGIPHAWHMQAHLAMRLGRWDKTTDRSWKAIELEKQYHQEMNVKPRDDHQFDHQMEMLTKGLIHDGRFREARQIKADAWSYGYRHWETWFRLHLAERDWAEAEKVVANFRTSNKATAAYYAALIALARNEPEKAKAEIETLRQGGGPSTRRAGRSPEFRLWETEGLLLCQTGAADEGLKLLAKVVEQTKADYQYHAWGGGGYYMEVWGQAALACGKFDVAEEAFLEALAHDAGSARAALGMQALCERQGRSEEATRYATLARRLWKRAEVKDFDNLATVCGCKGD